MKAPNVKDAERVFCNYKATEIEPPRIKIRKRELFH
jgi:hypothetical protein